MVTRFKNRSEAGRHLARELGHYDSRYDVVVFALPRGGVPVGYEVAQKIKAPLDVLLVRKLGVPGHEEYAMGAMASGDVIFLNHEVIAQLGISDEEVEGVIARERQELARREEAYGRNRRSLDLAGHTVILVDDGLATGSTMRAAVEAMRHHAADSIVVAVPVASPSTCKEMKAIADDVICVMQPEMFLAVGQWYEDFSQTTDEEVRELLQKAAKNMRTIAPAKASLMI